MLCTRQHARCWRYKYAQPSPGLSSLYISCRLLKYKTLSFPVLIPDSSHRSSVGGFSERTGLPCPGTHPSCGMGCPTSPPYPTITPVKGCASPFKIQVEHLLCFKAAVSPYALPVQAPGWAIPSSRLCHSVLQLCAHCRSFSQKCVFLLVQAQSFSCGCPRSLAGCLASDGTQ